MGIEADATPEASVVAVAPVFPIRSDTARPGSAVPSLVSRAAKAIDEQRAAEVGSAVIAMDVVARRHSKEAGTLQPDRFPALSIERTSIRWIP